MVARFFMVTFDLKNSKGREAEYQRADSGLKFRFGPTNFWKVVKQCRIVRTDLAAVDVRDALKQYLGGNCNILVVRLARGYAYSLLDRVAKKTANDCLPLIDN
jgi:hypothetical protein